MPGTDPRSDAELVDAANRGDTAAFEALYRRHRDGVARLAHRFTGSRDLALDVLQETFIFLLAKFPGFRLDAKLTTFLYPVVLHLSIAARRKAERYGGGEEPLRDLAAKPPPVDPAAADLVAALAALGEDHREVVLMRFVDDMSLEEIARALDIPLGTVKSRLHYALDVLRRDPGARRYFDVQ